MLIHFTGDVGSGKTLFCVHIALHDKRPIYSNFTIELPNYHDLQPEMLSIIDESTLVIIDEGYTWLESRRAGQNINLYLTYILFQSRKRNLDILITDQLLGTIDLRFRAMTNFEIHCEKVTDTSLESKENPEGVVGFKYTIFKCERGIYKYRISKLMMSYDFAKTIFPFYDTTQIVSPIDETLLLNISKDKSFIVDNINKAVDELFSKYPPQLIKKGIVADYCLRTNYPKSYVDIIYNRVRSRILENTKIEESGDENG